MHHPDDCCIFVWKPDLCILWKWHKAREQAKEGDQQIWINHSFSPLSEQKSYYQRWVQVEYADSKIEKIFSYFSSLWICSNPCHFLPDPSLVVTACVDACWEHNNLWCKRENAHDWHASFSRRGQDEAWSPCHHDHSGTSNPDKNDAFSLSTKFEPQKSLKTHCTLKCCPFLLRCPPEKRIHL